MCNMLQNKCLHRPTRNGPAVQVPNGAEVVDFLPHRSGLLCLYLGSQRPETEEEVRVFAQCLQTRAVQMKVAFKLDTYSFNMAPIRFVGRRAALSEVCRENSTNVVGCVPELKTL